MQESVKIPCSKCGSDYIWGQFSGEYLTNGHRALFLAQRNCCRWRCCMFAALVSGT